MNRINKRLFGPEGLKINTPNGQGYIVSQLSTTHFWIMDGEGNNKIASLENTVSEDAFTISVESPTGEITNVRKIYGNTIRTFDDKTFSYTSTDSQNVAKFVFPDVSAEPAPLSKDRELYNWLVDNNSLLWCRVSPTSTLFTAVANFTKGESTTYKIPPYLGLNGVEADSLSQGVVFENNELTISADLTDSNATASLNDGQIGLYIGFTHADEFSFENEEITNGEFEFNIGAAEVRIAARHTISESNISEDEYVSVTFSSRGFTTPENTWFGFYQSDETSPGAGDRKLMMSEALPGVYRFSIKHIVESVAVKATILTIIVE